MIAAGRLTCLVYIGILKCYVVLLYSLLKRITAIQNVMIEKQAFDMIMPFMNHASDHAVRETLAFISCLLFNANSRVQVEI